MDVPAKEIARREQHANNFSSTKKNTIIRALIASRLQMDEYHLLIWQKQQVLARLRTQKTEQLNSPYADISVLTSMPL